MRSIEIVELLLDKGAKVSAVDKVLIKVLIVMGNKLVGEWGRNLDAYFLSPFFTEGRHSTPHCYPREKPKAG